MTTKYHINVSEKDIENSKYCLICGDPGRVPNRPGGVSTHFRMGG